MGRSTTEPRALTDAKLDRFDFVTLAVHCQVECIERQHDSRFFKRSLLITSI